MASQILSQPGYLLNDRPERDPNRETVVSRARLRWQRRAQSGDTLKRFAPIAATIESRRATLTDATDEELATAIAKLRGALRQSGLNDEHQNEAFALIDATIFRVRGFHLHREQLFAGWLLMQGKLPEMATGEGKSLTAALAAITAALAGTPVHVITSNDYLVARDAEDLAPIAARFELPVAHANSEMDDDARRAAYASPICYVSNKQVAFDYLRDRSDDAAPVHSLTAKLSWLNETRVSEPILRGLCFAIVDEADSVLIDDAATPLILSSAGSEVGDSERLKAATSLFLAQQLRRDEHFTVDNAARQIQLTDDGEYQLAALAGSLKGTWKNRRYRSEAVRGALAALHCFAKDVDYLIEDGAIVLIDQGTGRSMPDRKLQNGLHQLIETKERCELSGDNSVLASISFQRFFPRYLHLCGMTGTAAEARRELARTYDLPVVPVPPHQRNQRVQKPALFASGTDEHIEAVVRCVQSVTRQGQAVLVGTRTLALSERLHDELRTLGLEPTVLNARQDADEAAVVARAGQPGQITIATNIAGRGTDIPVSPEVARAGGLHVLICELNDNPRVDRQLFGRAARQGDPGSYQYVLSLDDDLMSRFSPDTIRTQLAARLLAQETRWHRSCSSQVESTFDQANSEVPLTVPINPRAARRVGMALARMAQRRHEQRQQRLRRQVAKADQRSSRDLSFAGYRE